MGSPGYEGLLGPLKNLDFSKLNFAGNEKVVYLENHKRQSDFR